MQGVVAEAAALVQHVVAHDAHARMQAQVEKQARQFEQLIEKQAKMAEERLKKTPRKRKVVHI